MALIRCRECGRKFSNQAKSCPECGAPTKKPASILTGCVTVLVLCVAGIFCVIGSIGTNNPAKGVKPVTKGVIAPAAQQPIQEKPTVVKKSDSESLDAFMGVLKAAKFKWVRNVSAIDGCATITVSNDWHIMPYQLRLQAAQNLAGAWENAVGRPADALISIVDFNGNEVGGEGFGGVWVQK